jgi:hypothetical protein
MVTSVIPILSPTHAFLFPPPGGMVSCAIEMVEMKIAASEQLSNAVGRLMVNVFLKK